MLHNSIFDVGTCGLEKRTPYSVLRTPYSACENIKIVYMPEKKSKIRFEVPSNLIFSKTVSSLFAFLSLNNYLKKMETKTPKFYPVYSFFSRMWKNGVRSTEYGVHFFLTLGV